MHGQQNIKTCYTVTCIMLGPNIFMVLGKGCFYSLKDKPAKTGMWTRTVAYCYRDG